MAVVAQHGLQQSAVAAAHVDQVRDAAEVVGRQQSLGLDAGEVGHGAVEDGAALGVVAVPVEDGFAVVVAEGALAAADAVEQVGPGVVVLAAEHARELAQGAGVVAAQQFGQGSEHEAAWLALALGEHAQARQTPQQPEQGLAVGAAAAGKLLGRQALGPRGGQVVGDRQLGGHVEHLGDPVAAGELEEMAGEIRAGVHGGRAGASRSTA